MRSVVIAIADLNDAYAILPLFVDYLRFYNVERPVSECEMFLRDRIERGQSRVHLALLKGVTVGFARVTAGFSSLALAPSHHLSDLYVTPRARRNGVARTLLEAVRADAVAAGACELSLQTAHDNHAAQALYRSLGYRRDDLFLTYNLALAVSG